MERAAPSILAGCLVLGLAAPAAADPSDPQLVSAGPTPIDAPVRTELAIEDGAGPPFVALRGFPAIRRDGRVVAALQELGDDLEAEIVLLDVRTGDAVGSWTLPERIVHRDDGEIERIPDPAGVRRINARLARAGFVPLARLARVDGRSAEDPWSLVLEGGGLRVLATAPHDEEGSPLDATLEVHDARGRVRARLELADEEVDAAYGAPDGSFVVLDESFCACLCSSWPRLVPL